MIAKLYVVPFTKRLIVAMSMADAKSYTPVTLAYVRDVHKGGVIYKKSSYMLVKPYLGTAIVELTDDAKEALCLV